MAKIKIRPRVIILNKEIDITKNTLCKVVQTNFDATQLAELLSSSKPSDNLFFRWLKTTFWPNSVEIGDLELDTDSKSAELHKKYRDYLYDLLKNEPNIEDDAIGITEIKQSRVFFVELLLRMTAVALVIAKKQGDKAKIIIRLTQQFIGALSDIFKSEPEKSFLDKLRSEEHINFLNLFSVLTEEINLLNAHTTTISQTLDLLDELKYLILCRIIAELAPSKTAAYLESDTVENTLTTCQNEIISLHAEESSSSSQQLGVLTTFGNMSVIDLPAHIHNQSQIIRITQSSHLKSLYELLNKIELAIQFIRKVEDVIRTGGWVPIALKMFNFEELASRLNEHMILAFKLFDFNREGYLRTSAGQFFDRKLYDFKQKAKSFSFQTLCYLQCPTLLKRVAQEISTNLITLFSIQDVLQWELMPRQLMAPNASIIRLLSPHQNSSQRNILPQSTSSPSPALLPSSGMHSAMNRSSLQPPRIASVGNMASNPSLTYEEIIRIIRQNIIGLALAESSNHLNNPHLIETYIKLKREADAIYFSLQHISAAANQELQRAKVAQMKDKFVTKFNHFWCESEVQFALHQWQRNSSVGTSSSLSQPIEELPMDRGTAAAPHQSSTIPASLPAIHSPSVPLISAASPSPSSFGPQTDLLSVVPAVTANPLPTLPIAAGTLPPSLPVVVVPPPSNPPSLPACSSPANATGFLQQYGRTIAISALAAGGGAAATWWFLSGGSVPPLPNEPDDEFGAAATDIIQDAAPNVWGNLAKAGGVVATLFTAKKVKDKLSVPSEPSPAKSAHSVNTNNSAQSSRTYPRELRRAMSQPQFLDSTLTDELIDAHIPFRPRALSQ